MESSSSRNWLVGVDIGGTFTDVVGIRLGSSEVRAAKVPSQRNAPVAAIVDGLKAVGISPEEVENLIHGTTRVTNAIVEEKLPAVALVSTYGFEDTLAIARLRRRDLYRLDVPPRREPLVSAEQSFGVPGRIEHTGVVYEPIDLTALEQVVDEVMDHTFHRVALAFVIGAVSALRGEDVVVQVAVPDMTETVDAEVAECRERIGGAGDEFGDRAEGH